MIAMRLGWLVLEALLWWCFACFGNIAALALGMMLILIPVGTIPVSCILKNRIQSRIEVVSSLRKGENGIFTVLLENPTLFPLLRVRCDVTVMNQLNRERVEQRIFTWVMPKAARKCPLEIGSDFCGRLRISLDRIVLYDCFGLVGISVKTDACSHVTVLPETFEPVVHLVPNPYGTDDSDIYSQERPGGDLTETFQIREYSEGDSPRQIHWKLTGKFDRMIVRDPGLPISNDVLVFWERAGEGENPARIDAQAEVVISLCRSLVDSDIQFHVGWNDTENNVCVLHRIRDMEEFVASIPSLLRATGRKDAVSGAGLLLRSDADGLCAHMIYIAEQAQSEVLDLQKYGRVTMLLCGEDVLGDAIRFDANDYVRQLAEIHI